MRAFTALSAASVAMAMPAAAPAPIKVNLARSVYTRADGSANVAAILASVNNTMAKYHHSPLPYYPNLATSQQQKRATGNEALTDEVEEGNLDELYYGPGVVGMAKPQTFTFDFDTGSADVFIPGPTCGTAEGCDGTTKYNQGGTDQHRTTSVTYGSGEISGEDYSDYLAIAGLRARNQTIISLTEASGFSGSASDGLLGMGFSTIAQTGSPTYFENLMSQGVVTNKEFAFYLGRAKSNTQGKSELTLGGVDSSKYTGTPTQVAVTTPGYWQVAVDGVKVDGQSAGPTSAGQAAIDTGTTLVLAPTVAAAFIFDKVPGAVPIPMGEVTLYAIPCNTPAKYAPAITFAGKDFGINILDFTFGTLSQDFGISLGNDTISQIIGSAASSYCLAGVGSADLDPTENLYVVGDTFLKGWYSIYNYVNNGGKPSVSFAKAVGN